MTEQEKRDKIINKLAILRTWMAVNPKYGKGLDVEDCVAAVPWLDETIEALEQQEPVEPVPGLWDRDIQLYKCGACGGEIGAGEIAKYCFHCGRAVKWDG